ARERDRAAWRDARVVCEKADERAADLEAREERGRAEADLPAKQLVASVKALAPQRKLRGHAAHDTRVVAEAHDPTLGRSQVRGQRRLFPSGPQTPFIPAKAGIHLAMGACGSGSPLPRGRTAESLARPSHIQVLRLVGSTS